jgi:hypothetical protein
VNGARPGGDRPPEVRCDRERPSNRSKKARKISLRNSINRFCRECLYDPRERGSWRQQVEACTSPECPLFPVRPRSKARRAI